MSRTAVALERAAIALASLALSIGLIALLSGFFAGRDQAGVSAPSGPPGQAVASLGDRHLAAGQPDPAYGSDPPTSGAHHVVAVRRDGVALSDDQTLEALELGDVIVFYGGGHPPPGLSALAETIAGPFSPALAAGGQAVLIAPRVGVNGLVAVAWAHMLRVAAPGDPRLRQFLAYWLGRGAGGACC